MVIFACVSFVRTNLWNWFANTFSFVGSFQLITAHTNCKQNTICSWRKSKGLSKRQRPESIPALLWWFEQRFEHHIRRFRHVSQKPCEDESLFFVCSVRNTNVLNILLLLTLEDVSPGVVC